MSPISYTCGYVLVHLAKVLFLLPSLGTIFRKMALDSSLKSGLLMVSLLVLSACGGGGSDSSDGGGTTNRAPVANAGADQTVDELATVTLNGSGTDPDAGTTLTYAWSQRSGTSVVLSDRTFATPSFE